MGIKIDDLDNDLEGLLGGIADFKGDPIKAIRNLEPSEIDDIIPVLNRIMEALNKRRKSFIEKNGENKKGIKYYTNEEAAIILRIKKQTLARRVKDGRINSTKLGGKRLFTEDDLDITKLMSFVKTFDRAYCISSNICIDASTKDIFPFEKERLYRIVKENKVWVYLYSEKWDSSIKMSRTIFRKNFRIEGQFEYTAQKYKIMDSEIG